MSGAVQLKDHNLRYDFFQDVTYLRNKPPLTPLSVLEYFSSSKFFDPNSLNQKRRRGFAVTDNAEGVDYRVLESNACGKGLVAQPYDCPYNIQNQFGAHIIQRFRRSHGVESPELIYYCAGGLIYQAPSLAHVVTARLQAACCALQESLQYLKAMLKWHILTGYEWSLQDAATLTDKPPKSRTSARLNSASHSDEDSLADSCTESTSTVESFSESESSSPSSESESETETSFESGFVPDSLEVKSDPEKEVSMKLQEKRNVQEPQEEVMEGAQGFQTDSAIHSMDDRSQSRDRLATEHRRRAGARARVREVEGLSLDGNEPLGTAYSQRGERPSRSVQVICQKQPLTHTASLLSHEYQCYFKASARLQQIFEQSQRERIAAETERRQHFTTLHTIVDSIHASIVSKLPEPSAISVSEAPSYTQANPTKN